jgi:geranylgeranyl diphosphate synthase, type I
MSVMAPVPASLVTVAERVEQRLAALLDAETARWMALDRELEAPMRSLAGLVFSGGKRLRPAFCYWGFVGAGGDRCSEVPVDAGAAFELLHAFALFHDDVMDGSATRRGIRTTHLAFADRHGAGAWIGESRRFGEGVAILVGDLALVYADQMLSGASLEALAVWNELRIELNIGQYLDILGTAQSERTRERAERICRYKSGKYTVERPLHLGALLAAPERGRELMSALSHYGLPLGDAFQLRDDVLGAFGDEALTGKPVGDDLREGKPTPLLAIAHERSTSWQRQTLAVIGQRELDDAAVADIQKVLMDTGALDEVEATIERLTEQAVGALPAIAITDEARDALAELAHFVAWRQH